jgi:hypothetical protein
MRRSYTSFVSHSAVPLQRDVGGHHGFVFGIGLLGEERTGQIELAPRPPRIEAEAADVQEDGGDLLGGERIAERRHHRVEGSRRAAVAHDGVPVGIRFTAGESAVGEVGQVEREAGEGAGRAAAVATVACGAGPAVERGAVGGGGHLPVRRCRERQHQREEHRRAHGAEQAPRVGGHGEPPGSPGHSRNVGPSPAPFNHWDGCMSIADVRADGLRDKWLCKQQAASTKWQAESQELAAERRSRSRVGFRLQLSFQRGA